MVQSAAGHGDYACHYLRNESRIDSEDTCVLEYIGLQIGDGLGERKAGVEGRASHPMDSTRWCFLIVMYEYNNEKITMMKKCTVASGRRRVAKLLVGWVRGPLPVVFPGCLPLLRRKSLHGIKIRQNYLHPLFSVVLTSSLNHYLGYYTCR